MYKKKKTLSELKALRIVLPVTKEKKAQILPQISVSTTKKNISEDENAPD
jgi:hypothetical protein